MSDWIDFKELRSKLRFEDVLKFCNVRLTIKGDTATGFCPLPTHQGTGNSPSFSVHLVRRIWQCFGCKASGNVLDFAVLMSGGDPKNPQDVRRVALKLRDDLLSTAHDEAPATPSVTSSKQQTLVNPPLDFVLQGLDAEHAYLRERGFTDDTIRHFGLGYCNRGMLKGRVAIPLHDAIGNLVGYAGRLTKDSDVNERNPKYLLPGKRTRNGDVIEFQKSAFLYNGHRLQRPVDDLIVVEGFPSVWWLRQQGYENVVGLMGSSCSSAQASLVVARTTPRGRVWAFTDADGGGDGCAVSIFTHAARQRFVRWVRSEKGQPTDVARIDLGKLLKV